MSTALHLTVFEFETMIERSAFDHLHRKIELINGELLEMNPAGPIHDDYVDFLTDWSVRSTSRLTIHVRVQTGLVLEELNSRPEPDVMWIRADRYLNRHPTAADVRLAIEVADSSLDFDLVNKSALYAAANIVEYWIVDARSKRVHVLRSPQDGRYTKCTIFGIGESIQPIESCDRLLVLAELFNQMSNGA